MIMGKKSRQVIVGVVFSIVWINSSFADSKLDKQRAQYKTLIAAWNAKKMDQVKTLLPTLKTYPLYPYLEYRNLTENLSTVKQQQVEQFVATYSTLVLAKNLSDKFNDELIKRQDWQGFLQFTGSPPASVSGQCNYYYANWMIGDKKGVLNATKKLWLSGNDQPNACNKLFALWQKEGQQTANLTLLRIQLTLEKGNLALAKILVGQLPNNYKTMRSALTKLINKPLTLEEFAEKTSSTHFTRSVTKSIFPYFARADLNKAQAALPKIARLQKLKPEEKHMLEYSIVWRLFGSDVSEKQQNWRDKFIASSHNADLIERRARLALGMGDYKDLNRWIKLLPAEVKQKDVWQYWQASILLNLDKTKEGTAILESLTHRRGFYPMLSAQRLHIAYPLKIISTARPDKTWEQDKTIIRIKELLYWDMRDQASVEWYDFVSKQRNENQELLARYAFEQNWGDYSIQATIAARLWDHLEERFPLAFEDIFRQAVDNKEITQYYAMAIARQESGLNPSVSSPVGARGLMQLMPATAKDAAKMADLKHYKHANQLFDPETNIHLGTSYLDYVYQRFDKNRVLASAAYNAGPARVNRWLDASAGTITADAFIESIPFNETRNYVKNVLTYDVFYRYFMGEKSTNLLTEEEWDKQY